MGFVTISKLYKTSNLSRLRHI